jgi:hypothetical protein
VVLGRVLVGSVFGFGFGFFFAFVLLLVVNARLRDVDLAFDFDDRWDFIELSKKVGEITWPESIAKC